MNTYPTKRPDRRNESGELDVFDATLYFSGGLDHVSTGSSVGQSISPHTELQSTMLKQNKRSISPDMQSTTLDQEKRTTWSIIPHTQSSWSISPQMRSTKLEQEKQWPAGQPISPQTQLARPNRLHREVQSTILKQDNRSKHHSNVQSISPQMQLNKTKGQSSVHLISGSDLTCSQSSFNEIREGSKVQLTIPSSLKHNSQPTDYQSRIQFASPTSLEHGSKPAKDQNRFQLAIPSPLTCNCSQPTRDQSSIQLVSPSSLLRSCSQPNSNKTRDQSSLQRSKSGPISQHIIPQMQMQSTNKKEQSAIQLQSTTFEQDKRSKPHPVDLSVSPDIQLQSITFQQNKRSNQWSDAHMQLLRPIRPHKQLQSDTPKQKQHPVGQSISPHMQLQSTTFEQDRKSADQPIISHMQLQPTMLAQNKRSKHFSIDQPIISHTQLQLAQDKRSKHLRIDQPIISHTQLQPTMLAQDKRSKHLPVDQSITHHTQFQSTMFEQSKRPKQRQVGRPITPHTQLQSTTLEQDKRSNQPSEPDKRSKPPSSIVAKFASIVGSIFNHTKCNQTRPTSAHTQAPKPLQTRSSLEKLRHRP